jgi:hypothetical protein
MRASFINDVVVVVEDGDREFVAAQMFPDVFDRIEFGSVRWQTDKGDVFGDRERGSNMIAVAIEDESGVATAATLRRKRKYPMCRCTILSLLAALRSSEAVRSSRVIDTAAPIDAAALKSQHRVRVSLIWVSPMSHSFGQLVRC